MKHMLLVMGSCTNKKTRRGRKFTEENSKHQRLLQSNIMPILRLITRRIDRHKAGYNKEEFTTTWMPLVIFSQIRFRNQNPPRVMMDYNDDLQNTEELRKHMEKLPKMHILEYLEHLDKKIGEEERIIGMDYALVEDAFRKLGRCLSEAPNLQFLKEIPELRADYCMFTAFMHAVTHMTEARAQPRVQEAHFSGNDWTLKDLVTAVGEVTNKVILEHGSDVLNAQRKFLDESYHKIEDPGEKV